MTFHPIDLTIIAVYMLITLALGFLVRHRAVRKLESYFLITLDIPIMIGIKLPHPVWCLAILS